MRPDETGADETGADETGADEWVLTQDQEDRAVALTVARDLLLVKGGKFAERPLDPTALITVARWILDGEERITALSFEGGTPMAEQGKALAEAIAAHERLTGGKW
ncbi:hypothetical protein [Aeromicrobium sp.]|uniref:hypothetical protein n=1 Tax=Aeromicrobium sp. TaxID=1871063 RepID=UPI0030BAC00E